MKLADIYGLQWPHAIQTQIHIQNQNHFQNQIQHQNQIQDFILLSTATKSVELRCFPSQQIKWCSLNDSSPFITIT